MKSGGKKSIMGIVATQPENRQKTRVSWIWGSGKVYAKNQKWEVGKRGMKRQT